jgi:uncharacterized sporulation protein YeaH/YhbH (DUF444 family)
MAGKEFRYNPGGVNRDHVGSGLGRIEEDASRFRRIVRGQVRQNLRKYMSDGGLIGRQGKDLVKIPITEIQLPHFRYGRGQGGVGQGEGEEGDPLGPGQSGGDSGPGGTEAGSHVAEVWEVVQMVVAELLPYIELPDLLPLLGEVVEKILRVKGVTLSPTGAVDKKRTVKNIFKRVTTGPEWPMYMGDKHLKVYKDFQEIVKPSKNLTAVHIFDISGSISGEKREIIRQSMFWVDVILDELYKDTGKVGRFYVAHDTQVYPGLSQADALAVSSGGGTVVSIALEALLRYTKENPATNLITFYWGDGENSGSVDDAFCGKLLKQLMTEHLWFRGFYYSQICPSSYSSDLLRELRIATKGLATDLGTNLFKDATIKSLDEIPKGILTLIGRKGAVAEAGF